jgi:hypothetical protein
MAFQAVLFQGDYQFLHGDLMSFVPSGLVGITIADGEHVADLGRIQSVGNFFKNYPARGGTRLR